MDSTELGTHVGCKIKALREARRMKRRDVARHVRHGYQWLWDIENGRRMPTVPDTMELAALFGVGVEEILGDPDHAAQ
jgi:transcriptional regulator with XRE-family HTH domain